MMVLVIYFSKRGRRFMINALTKLTLEMSGFLLDNRFCVNLFLFGMLSDYTSQHAVYVTYHLKKQKLTCMITALYFWPKEQWIHLDPLHILIHTCVGVIVGHSPVCSSQTWTSLQCYELWQFAMPATFEKCLGAVKIWVYYARQTGQFSRYCFTRWILKLPGIFELPWVRQHLVNVFFCWNKGPVNMCNDP